MKTAATFLLLLLITVPLLAQPAAFWLEGTVHGYEYDPNKLGLLKKNKPSVFEGTLEKALIRVYLEDELVAEVRTNDNGNYRIPFDFNKLYTLTITKEGYSTKSLMIDTRAFPKLVQQGGYRYVSAEFVINSFRKGQDKKLNRTLGRLYFNPATQLFTVDKTSHTNGNDAATELLDRSVTKNNERIASYEPLVRLKARSEPSRTLPTVTDLAAYEIKISEQESLLDQMSEQSKLTISPRLNLGPEISPKATNNNGLITNKQEAIQKAREQLALDKLRQQTRFDSLEILKREAQIVAAEKEILNAHLHIQSQQDRLDAQRYSLMLLLLLLLLLSGFLFLVYTFFKSKQQSSLMLEQQNKQITDSINYAQRIQQSILVGERTLKRYLPDSFVLSEPRDIVSGDFYFFHPHPDGLVIAVADCTGHGVPGAFMSLIGYRLLREIVAEKGITDPALILDQLNKGVLEALQGEKEGDILQDGMDISVCLIDTQNKTITFAAAMNSAYLFCGTQMQVLQADISSVGGKVLRGRRNRPFTNKALTYSSGNMLYLFSDGYMDQFGAELDQKFNTKRFKQMLLNMQPLAACKQKEEAHKTLLRWKGSVRQTDDILLMGIRLP